MGKIISNGIEYSGLMNVEGAFIDTNNVIQVLTQYTPSNSWSYTATQDCVVYIELFNNEGYTITLKLNGKEVASHYDDTEKIRIAHTIFVKKGQVLTTESSSYPSGVNTRFAVYGIQSGSNVIKAENNYSTDEQVIGTWIDGSTVYQKTYSLQNPITIHNEDNLTSYIDIFSNISNIVGFFATSDVYKTYAPITVIVDSGQLLAIVSSTLGNINTLTIQYTKTQGGE